MTPKRTKPKRPLVIKADRFYRTRDGRKAWVGWVGERICGLILRQAGCNYWRPCGQTFIGSLHEDDLISPWREPRKGKRG